MLQFFRDLEYYSLVLAPVGSRQTSPAGDNFVVMSLAADQLRPFNLKFYKTLNVIGWCGFRLAVVIRRGAFSSNAECSLVRRSGYRWPVSPVESRRLAAGYFLLSLV